MVSNNRDIIDFVGTNPFLRFDLQVAMETMLVYKVQTCVSFRNIFFPHLGGPKEQFVIRKNVQRVLERPN